MKKYFSPVQVILASLVMILPVHAFAADSIYKRTVTGNFDEIRIDIENAILNRGFVIDFHARVGDMLNRTAPDTGDSQMVYTAADSWQFCSAALSRKMVEVNAINIAYCPYIVFAYATVDNPNNIVVGFRRHDSSDPATAEVLKEINTLLGGIVDETVE